MAKHLVWLALMAAIVSAALIQSAPVKARWDRVGAEIPLERITNMWAPDENEIYFAGIPSLYRYDVNGWSPVEIDGQRLVVNDLWGGSATSWFGIDADNGGIIWRDGPDWHSYGLGPEHELYTIWGSGPNDIYVGGYSAMLHYDGRDWSRVNEIGYRSVLSISGNSPDNVYALCGRYQIYHFDGTSWRQVWLSGLWLDALWTAPTGETIAVGSDGCILRGQGDTWTQQDS